MDSKYSFSTRAFSPFRALALVLCLSLLAGCAMPRFLKPPSKDTKPVAKVTTVALVVPAGKSASSVSALASGARLAAKEQPAGSPVQVQVIPVQGNWLKTLAALPDRSVIGGPLSETVYKQMKQAGILDKKVVFAFLPQIDAGDEGNRAWRFFFSTDDQIDAVVKLVVDRMDIRSVASFGQPDKFAIQATSLLEQKLASRNIILQRIGVGSDPSSWSAAVKPVVNAEKDEVTGALIPKTPFEAVFVTESWRRLTSVHTAFGSNGEDRLVMVGPLFWDGYNRRGTQNASSYKLVAYPSAFLRSRAPQSLATSSYATFWGALGYDFVRFAARLNVSGRPDASRVNAAARQAALMNFVMAPISYDASGRAKQGLFMVQPGVAGPELVDLNAMRAARAQAIQRVEDRRVQPAEPVITPVRTQSPSMNALPPATPTGPIMRDTPHSSHKLSLPGTR